METTVFKRAESLTRAVDVKDGTLIEYDMGVWFRDGLNGLGLILFRNVNHEGSRLLLQSDELVVRLEQLDGHDAGS
jgi:hypothetical protein